MKLTFEQIKAITVGAVRIWESDDGIRFSKCTEKQVAAWYALNDVLGQRAETTTGIRLDFYTNSEYLELSAFGGNRFELHINGLFVSPLPMQTLWNEGKTATYDLTPYRENGECRVTVIFPSHAVGVLDGLCLSDGAYLRRPDYDVKLLFIGDSITQGYDSGLDSHSYAWRVTKMLNAESVIHGVGGGRFHASLFDRIPFDPDYVIVAFGTNDFNKYTTYDELREHARSFLSLIAEEYSHKNLYAVSPIWRARSTTMPMGEFEEARAVIAKEAESLGFIHIDGMKLVPHRTEFYADEWLHPNAEGFSHYAENLVIEMGLIHI
ncbi:MAG: SGNH/GDSL hydrolase family protein [Clostridia bacterium]|nr:SGNH/GDSL hydrolase family protein [Clostridia bacterium]